MTKFLDQINEQNLEIVCILIAVGAIILAIIVILDTIAKRRKENIVIEDIKIQETPQVELIEEISTETPTSDEKLSKTTPIEEIKYVEENSEEEKTKAKIELKNLKETLMKIESEVETPVPIINEVKEEIKETPIKEEVELDLFNINEKRYLDEEENAIISIDELHKASQNAYSDEEMYKYDDEGNEPISIQELEKLQNTIKMSVIEEHPVVETKKEEIQRNYYEKPNNTFQTTPDISPIYGVRKTEESISLEQTANYDKLNEEIRKTTEFLATLKELRKNLE